MGRGRVTSIQQHGPNDSGCSIVYRRIRACHYRTGELYWSPLLVNQTGQPNCPTDPPTSLERGTGW